MGCRTLFNTCCHTIDAQLLMESESCTRKYKHNDNSQFHIMTCQILYFTYRLDIGTVHCTLSQAVRFFQQIKSNTFTTESIRSKVNTVVGWEANRVSQRAHNATSGTFYVSMCEIYYSMSSTYILYLGSTLFGYYLLFRIKLDLRQITLCKTRRATNAWHSCTVVHLHSVQCTLVQCVESNRALLRKHCFVK